MGGPPAWGARAPGRVNWIGEHTDYEEGFVLPSAIDRDTIVWAAPTSGKNLSLQSEGFGRAVVDLGALARRDNWVDYVQGVAFAFQERGLPLAGAEISITSAVPPNAGLSSSAALSVALAFALDRLFGFELPALELARIAHRAENGFVGVGCGVLDHFASALGQPGTALRIDCRDHGVRPIQLETAGLALLISESGVERRLVTGEYGDRVAECRQAFQVAKEHGLLRAPATHLRDLAAPRLAELEPLLAPHLFRRARHVVTENTRVDQMAEALGVADLARAGALLAEGQASLRDDFEVSVPELDRLCADADAHAGTFGSRLTGAGFGGCTLHLVAADQAASVSEAIQAGFSSSFARTPTVHQIQLGPGAEALDAGDVA